MEWLKGLAVVPALICGGMMLAMGAMAAFGLRRTQDSSQTGTPRADTPDRGTRDAGVHDQAIR
jgi:hypothetical protein